MHVPVLLVLLVKICVTNIDAQRILFVSIPSFSHMNGLLSIGEALVENYPNVQVSFALFDEHVSSVRKKLPHVNVVHLGSLSKTRTGINFLLNDGESNLRFIARVTLPGFLSVYNQMHDHLLAAKIDMNFELLIINMFAFAAQDLAHDLRVPFVIHSCSSVEGSFDLPSWIPRGFDARSQDELRTSFLARLDNYLIEPLRMVFHLGPGMMELHRLRRQVNRTTQSLLPFLTNPMERWHGHPILIPYPRALDFRRAYTPNYHFLGFVLDHHSYETRPNEVSRRYLRKFSFIC